MKILLLGEYSGFHSELKNALTQLGHSVTLAAANDFWKKIPVDIDLGSGSNIFEYKLKQLFLPLLRINRLSGFDVVHIINFYIIPRIPLINLHLVKRLREHNGLVTLAGAGDDPFFVRYSEETMRYSPIPHHELHDRKRPYYMRGKHHLDAMHNYMEYVDGVIPIMYEYYSTFRAAGYSDKTSTPFPIPIKPNILNQRGRTTKKIVFFHGLNRPGFKGTHIISRCFDTLSSKYPNDVECFIRGHMPFKEYIELITQTDVSVDQVYSYSLAMNALYSMLQGKIVVGGVEPESSILYGGSLPPAFNALPDTNELMSTFERILDLRLQLADISHSARNFVLENHNPSNVAKRYIEYWTSLATTRNSQLIQGHAPFSLKSVF